MKDYGFQKTARRKLYESLRTHRSTILQQPTGSGKTHVAMDIIKDGLRNDRRIMFGADRLTLIDQTLDRFYEEGIPFGVIQGDHPLQNAAAPVQIASVQTLQRRGRKQWPEFNLGIFDEAHTNYSVIGEMIDTWDNLKYIGLSATPFTRGLGLVWDDLVVATTTAELIEQGYLSDYEAFAYSQPDLSGVRRSGGDFSTPDLEERMGVLTGDIVAHYIAHGNNGKALAFTPTVAYAQSLAHEFQMQGIDADHVSGYDTDERRREVMDKYANGDIQVLTNCDVLTKGFDQPDIEVGILARPTRSLSLHIQMCGRYLRVGGNREKKLILDHASNIERLGFPDDPLPTELDMGEHGTNSDTRQRDEPQPWNCPKCHSLVPARTRQCTVCGHMAQRQHEVTVEAGVLQKIERTGMSQKQATYAMLNSIRIEKGYQQGWAANQYKELFGVWPRKIDTNATLDPAPELCDWVDKKRRNFLANRHIRRNYQR
jgi:superfamily II DNA or RNA helicase